MDDDRNPKRLRIPTPPPSTAQPEIPPSPPRFVSLEELMAAAKGMTQMSLAHEIAVNKDFKLEPKKPENSIEKIVKETMHKVFWDILDAELKSEPPKYNQALVLIEEVKTSLLDLLLPQHSRLKQRIDEVLDMELIKQQADKGTLYGEYMGYAQFVISTMGKLCAPVRDEKIAELTQTSEIVPLFKGMLETLNIMKVDMANFAIDFIRPTVIANSVAYEQEKFANFLKVNPDGLERTKKWLSKHTSAAKEKDGDTNAKIEHVINRAYLDLLQWPKDEELPETLTMDHSRIMEYTDELTRLTNAGSVLLITFSFAGPHLVTVAEWKQKVKGHVLLLEKEKVDPSVMSAKITVDIAEGVEKYQATGHRTEGLKEALENDVQRIYSLLSTRIQDFLLSAIASNTAERLRIPTGLSTLQEELTKFAGRFLLLVSHNRQVFGKYYADIISESLSVQDEGT